MCRNSRACTDKWFFYRNTTDIYPWTPQYNFSVYTVRNKDYNFTTKDMKILPDMHIYNYYNAALSTNIGIQTPKCRSNGFCLGDS